MIRQITVEHVTFVTDRPFDAVVEAFNEQVGSLEQMGWPAIPAASRDQEDFERRVRDVLGPSGFTRFLTIDHGEWVTKQGHATRFFMYTIGNPMIAITMIEHHVEAGLDVPVRLAIYEHPDGKTRLVFNTPSSLMSGLENEAVHRAALKLDAKLMALGEAVTGVKA
ncbi:MULTISPECIES: DUF302 domain-containing protein [Rhodomicrobium]|uniref:DUF302 domain-containing protein n=1 Tax=Rhodomicrobium TaxID=1068 RepID=UPI000B4B5730|nr:MULTISPECIES: DUF302 domain-containing protein [Rhodomicrobium]